jgi:hypothetical protein
MTEPDNLPGSGPASNADPTVELRAQLETAQAALAESRTREAATTAALRDSLRAANPTLPADLIDGSNADELRASVEKATAIRDSVLAAHAAASGNGHAVAPKVPAGGGPATPPTEGLTPLQRIAAGLEARRSGN